jgi:DNA-binding ferritin-like protein
VVSETNLSDTFGGRETQDLNGPETFETYMDDFDLSFEEAAERTRQQGKEPDPKIHKKKLSRVPKKIKKDKNYIDTFTLIERKKIEEIRKEKMTKMVEDMLVKKSKDSDVNKKNQSLSKLLTKNLESIKKIAEKEGTSISDLIKVLKKSE